MSHTVAYWNANFCPGTPVAYFYLINRPDRLETVTAGIAARQDDVAMVAIDGVRGLVPIDRLAVPGVSAFPEVTLPPLCKGHKPMARALGPKELEAWVTLHAKGDQKKCPRCGQWLFPCEE
jgi:hypothetical protein